MVDQIRARSLKKLPQGPLEFWGEMTLTVRFIGGDNKRYDKRIMHIVSGDGTVKFFRVEQPDGQSIFLTVVATPRLFRILLKHPEYCDNPAGIHPRPEQVKRITGAVVQWESSASKGSAETRLGHIDSNTLALAGIQEAGANG